MTDGAGKPAVLARLRRARRPAHWAVRRGALWAARPYVRAGRSPAPPGERRRVRVLLMHANGTGGTIRTVLNLCGHLAAEHDIEILSVLRARREPFFPMPAGVRVTVADDRLAPRGRVPRALARLPSVLTPVDEASFRRMNLWTDLCLLRALRVGPPPHVLVGTRPSLNLLIAELAPRSVATVGQDHANLRGYRDRLRAEIVRRYPRLAVVSALTERTRADYAGALAGTPARVVRIPNAVPALVGGPSPREAKVVLAAGRLVRGKGFDLLVRAFEPLAAEHPDWTLRIFGGGDQHARLKAEIAGRGLAGRVELRARTPSLAGEMERASIYALSSRREGLPMVVLEAMAKGLPVVAFDCPTGPAELITPGRDGLLVPPGDVGALTAALRELIEDPGLRDRLGEEARRSARAYDLDRVGPAWSDVLRGL
ncbi:MULTISPECIES: glycosyltransferase family 4 protein [Actinomadura]|uniref:Glycosyltransferase family 4 protein n=1 Tax=Actinomadura yumaensis TaxID=111807 RepID=A0ABW2D1A9_9ACTN|nr:glycosyltransferase family 4 protein [Actinomadura sp. J1-007]MWK39408.1 glycosyltransferase [Actinomadura sp. J1-007]